jgi:hypothetical protein
MYERQLRDLDHWWGSTLYSVYERQLRDLDHWWGSTLYSVETVMKHK